jgi:hypothetical protein
MSATVALRGQSPERHVAQPERQLRNARRRRGEPAVLSALGINSAMNIFTADGKVKYDSLQLSMNRR